MQPYQEASQESIRQRVKPVQAVGALAFTGVQSALASKILPLLSDYIPQSIARKGLGKIDPRLEKFVNAATDMGHSYDEIKEFIKQKVSPSEKQQPAKENRNIIEQYSPELFQFLKGHLDQGRNPLEAGALAQLDSKFKGIISKIESDHKTPWSGILQTVFGNSQTQKPQQPQQAQAQNQGQNNNDEAIMAALQKILNM